MQILYFYASVLPAFLAGIALIAAVLLAEYFLPQLQDYLAKKLGDAYPSLKRRIKWL